MAVRTLPDDAFQTFVARQFKKFFPFFGLVFRPEPYAGLVDRLARATQRPVSARS